jgi:hypothetical protein
MRIEEIPTGLIARLHARRPEIEQAILDRVQALGGPQDTSNPEYAHGLRATVSLALDHSLAALGRSEERTPPVPAMLLAQARLAARAGVSLDTVLRRYVAGYTLLGDFLISAAAEGSELRGRSLQRLLRTQAALFDQVLSAVSEEYSREQQGRLANAEQRRADRVRRLLAGELLDTSELAYDFEGHHMGMIATGPRAARWLAELAKALDRRLLLVCREQEAVWAWLGSGRRFEREELEGLVARDLPGDLVLALGEPGQGLSGWRLTHRQARAALPIALRGDRRLICYGDVALLASMMRDDLLTASLRTLYLAPLAQERDGGTVAMETLRAYFAAGRNASSAAAALNVSRQTVKNRLGAIEERIGRSLSVCANELEAALRLERLGPRGQMN